ncbi:social motility and stimulation tgl protein [Hyalangium sp.]|uniref:social motility and stimulation tgl protein n=1 Tax=Hyalangium sp. TaxID=2028555 RepID=UPI002D2F03C3|nr:social motility and stimulation tgl protein [Hyalangium sp.]HYH98998.1 social motility and stimulation tgl protein [Hyalangium sp.]
MFNIDERYRGLPASREQVIALHTSLNSPHLFIPGKPAGPAQAFILGLRGSTGFATFIYLYLSEAADCAVYVSGKRNTSFEEYLGEEGEALAFVESMGFMMDNSNWRSLPQATQEDLLKTLPVFFRDPKQVPAVAKKVEEKRNAAATLGRFLAAF